MKIGFSVKRIATAGFIAASALVLGSCKGLIGSHHDDTNSEIFEEGRIDPNLVPATVGYMPILPVWEGFSNPVDVFVGYDEMVYVVDDNGLNVLDLKGTRHRIIPIPGAIEVTQDRRLHTYVSGLATVNVNGAMVELAAVYHLQGTSGAGGEQFLDTIIHPFDDVSRQNVPFRQEDRQVRFTGLATWTDNTLLVARSGPVNDATSAARPDNAILFFSPEGENIGYANGLNPRQPSLKSTLGISGIATFSTPPQRINAISQSHDFLLAQKAAGEIEFRVLGIVENYDPDAGVVYGEATTNLDFDTTRATGFVYESFKFDRPEDVYISAEEFSFWVADAGKDSIYQFSSERGWEGVPPPPGSGLTKYVNVSFGGTGSGPFQFREPSGVCHIYNTLYVADKGNNRIMRYRLSTDLE